MAAECQELQARIDEGRQCKAELVVAKAKIVEESSQILALESSLAAAGQRAEHQEGGHSRLKQEVDEARAEADSASSRLAALQSELQSIAALREQHAAIEKERADATAEVALLQQHVAIAFEEASQYEQQAEMVHELQDRLQVHKSREQGNSGALENLRQRCRNEEGESSHWRRAADEARSEAASASSRAVALQSELQSLPTLREEHAATISEALLLQNHCEVAFAEAAQFQMQLENAERCAKEGKDMLQEHLSAQAVTLERRFHETMVEQRVAQEQAEQEAAALRSEVRALEARLFLQNGTEQTSRRPKLQTKEAAALEMMDQQNALGQRRSPRLRGEDPRPFEAITLPVLSSVADAVAHVPPNWCRRVEAQKEEILRAINARSNHNGCFSTMHVAESSLAPVSS